ncbi:MAG: hypothetical protein H6917_08110 [Novosphingobium sp.]|nr:hypothetical protein [Novosphingobium sp.]MCP5402337.1 hypothetical protein [Novosphingobium sp.]
MTIRFAAANRGGFNAFVAPMFVASIPLRAANDNMHGTSNDKLLKAALRHFAEHGLCAAEHARENAERAFFEGDRPGYRWWLAICHTLDRRMADAVSARFCFEGESEADPRPAGNLT